MVASHVAAQKFLPCSSTAVRPFGLRRLDVHVRHVQRHALRGEVVLLDRRRIVEALQLGPVRRAAGGVGRGRSGAGGGRAGVARLPPRAAAALAGVAAEAAETAGATAASRKRSSGEARTGGENSSIVFCKERPGRKHARFRRAVRPTPRTSARAHDSTTRRPTLLPPAQAGRRGGQRGTHIATRQHHALCVVPHGWSPRKG